MRELVFKSRHVYVCFRTAYLPGIRVKIMNERPVQLKEGEDNLKEEADDFLPTHMRFDRDTIAELSQEGSLDGGLSDIPYHHDSELSLGPTEKRLNGGTPAGRVRSSLSPSEPDTE